MNSKAFFTIMIVSLIVFIGFAVATTVNERLTMDGIVIAWLKGASSGLLLDVMGVVTHIGAAEVILVLTLAIAAWLFYKKQYIYSLFVIFVTGSGVVVNYILKVLFQRERPEETEYIEVLGQSLELVSYSFPSGHMMRVTLLVAVVMYLSGRYIKNRTFRFMSYAACALLAVVVGISRILLGEHFPSDIIAAIAASVAWFCCSVLLLGIAKKKWGISL